MIELLIDTDPGMDDALAILLALKSPAVNVRALTAVTGNLPASRTAQNVLKLLDLAVAPPKPVARGPEVPLGGDYPTDPFSHGADGLAGSNLPASTRALDHRSAAQLIVDTADACDGELVIAALGPLTNIAQALALDPELPRKVRSLTIIGGSFGLTPFAWSQATGDNPVSEWNIFVDPEAAALVFAAGFNLVTIGLDIATHPSINFRPSDLQRLRTAATPASALAMRVVEFVHSRGYQSYCSLIDSVAIAAIIDPSLISTVELRVGVECAGTLTRGMTVVERRNHHGRTDLPTIATVATLDFDGFLDLVTETLVGEVA